MSAVLLDTHTWAWSLNRDVRLSAKAIQAIEQAEAVFVSPISFFEIGQKVRLGKWPEMDSFVKTLPDLLLRQGAREASLGMEICLSAASMEWGHRDPFDRMLAATSIHLGLPLISADTIFDQLSQHRGWHQRLW
jgi:PIN domain nuclease of toxin-antitoxin system